MMICYIIYDDVRSIINVCVCITFSGEAVELSVGLGLLVETRRGIDHRTSGGRSVIGSPCVVAALILIHDIPHRVVEFTRSDVHVDQSTHLHILIL